MIEYHYFVFLIHLFISINTKDIIKNISSLSDKTGLHLAHIL